MRGRILGIKKSYILAAVLALSSALFLFSTLVSVLVFHLDFLWFYLFCLCAGIYQLCKAALFKLDSALYVGTLLFTISIAGIYSFALNLWNFFPVLLLSSFFFASFVTFALFSQKFHLYFSILLLFIAISLFFMKINIISSAFFVALTVANVLIFVIGYTLLQKL